MKTRRLVSLVMLFTFIATGSVLAATVDVSQPVQMTNDSHYERGQSVIYDGTDYWLFYGRSVGCTGSYESGTPDTHDYEVYYKKASSVAGLAAATAVKVPGAHNGNVYLGETTAVYWGGYVRVFAAVDVGATAALYQWYTNNGGASWGEGASATGLPDGAAHSDSASCGGKLWLVPIEA